MAVPVVVPGPAATITPGTAITPGPAAASAA